MQNILSFSHHLLTSGRTIAAVYNSLRNNIKREARNLIIKWTLLMGIPPEHPGGWVTGIGTVEVKC